MGGLRKAEVEDLRNGFHSLLRRLLHSLHEPALLTDHQCMFVLIQGCSLGSNQGEIDPQIDNSTFLLHFDGQLDGPKISKARKILKKDD